MNQSASLSKPLLFDSQLKYRIGLARQRMQSYPLDDLNYITMDLEHPALRHRHADFCTGDLTGRTLLFYVLADGVDGVQNDQIKPLYERIMNARNADGSFGSLAGEAWPTHFISALINYYAQYGDMRALNAARALADHLLNTPGKHTALPTRMDRPHPMTNWAVECLAELYRETREERYLNEVRRLATEAFGGITNAHSHGYLTTLRGILRAAEYASDTSLADLVKARYQEILDQKHILPDGNVSEVFHYPYSSRNEGCSIADWVMLNLAYGHYFDDENAYALAEHSLWNALYLNQMVTGGFGHRYLTSRGGYLSYIREAWWCCTPNAGMALAEVARHAVTVREGRMHLNLWIPGEYTLPYGGGSVRITVTTAYPRLAQTRVRVEGTREDIAIRIPAGVRAYTCRRVETALGYDLYLDGKMGHYLTELDDGYILRYGPLVLAPMNYMWNVTLPRYAEDGSTVPAGYIGDALSREGCAFALTATDENGFYPLDTEKFPRWLNFEEGEMSRVSDVNDIAAYVPMKWENGSACDLYFQPICIATSNLTINDLPIVFD